jgi:phage-related protein
MTRKTEGFIVHPYETVNNKYHASYGNDNKTVKSFKTLGQAKEYLKKHGMKSALYDAPSGARTVSVQVKRKIQAKKNRALFGNNWVARETSLGGL